MKITVSVISEVTPMALPRICFAEIKLTETDAWTIYEWIMWIRCTLGCSSSDRRTWKLWMTVVMSILFECRREALYGWSSWVHRGDPIVGSPRQIAWNWPLGLRQSLDDVLYSRLGQALHFRRGLMNDLGSAVGFPSIMFLGGPIVKPSTRCCSMFEWSTGVSSAVPTEEWSRCEVVASESNDQQRRSISVGECDILNQIQSNNVQRRKNVAKSIAPSISVL